MDILEIFLGIPPGVEEALLPRNGPAPDDSLLAEDRKLMCEICDRQLGSISLVWRHYYDAHLKAEVDAKCEALVNNKMCRVCSKEFGSRQVASCLILCLNLILSYIVMSCLYLYLLISCV